MCQCSSSSINQVHQPQLLMTLQPFPSASGVTPSDPQKFYPWSNPPVHPFVAACANVPKQSTARHHTDTTELLCCSPGCFLLMQPPTCPSEIYKSLLFPTLHSGYKYVSTHWLGVVPRKTKLSRDLLSQFPLVCQQIIEMKSVIDFYILSPKNLSTAELCSVLKCSFSPWGF